MQPNDYLLSLNQQYQLTMWPDGNVTVGLAGQTSPLPPNQPWLWQSGTSGSNNATCVMSAGGDFIIINASGAKISHSATSGNVNAYLCLENTGDLYILTASGAQLVPPWDNGGMHPYPAFRSSAPPAPQPIAAEFRDYLRTLQAHLVQLERFAVQLGANQLPHDPPHPIANGDAKLSGQHYTPVAAP
jgi:hypothetical protein